MAPSLSQDRKSGFNIETGEYISPFAIDEFNLDLEEEGGISVPAFNIETGEYTDPFVGQFDLPPPELRPSDAPQEPDFSMKWSEQDPSIQEEDINQFVQDRKSFGAKQDQIIQDLWLQHGEASKVAAELKKAYTTNPDEEPEIERAWWEFPKLFAKGVAHGTVGLAESANTALQWIGHRVNSDTLASAGEEGYEYWSEYNEENFGMPKDLQGKNLWDNPDLLASGAYWFYNVGEMVPSLAAALIPGTGVAKGVQAVLKGRKILKIGSKVIPLTVKNSERLMQLAGAVTGGIVGGGLEATHTYQGVLKRGGSETEAANAAMFMAIGAGFLNGIGSFAVLRTAGKSFAERIAKFVGAGVIEGFTEGLEEPVEVLSEALAKKISTGTLPKDLDTLLIQSLKDGLTVAPIAAITGVGGAIVSDVLDEGKGKGPVNTVTTRNARTGELLTKGTNVNIHVKDPKAPESNAGRTLFAQVDYHLTQPGDPEADSYFDELYSKRKGYKRSDHAWEVSGAATQVAHMSPNSDYLVVKNVDSTIDFLNESGYDTVMFSVMDVNKDIIKQIAKGFKGRVIAGGYVDKSFFDDTFNVEYHPTMQSAAKALGVEYKKGDNYRFFRNTETIPRVCLSTGCQHKCVFCTVPKGVTEIPADQVTKQINNFKSLDYNLVYVDDKTFGQAKNFKDLIKLNKRIKKENPDFDGFIIQTSATQLLKLEDQFLQDSGIKFVELGIESYNDDILSKLKKPHRVEHIDEAVKKIRSNKMALIPNIIVGSAGKTWAETEETYQNTLDFLTKNKDVISHVNVYNMALYAGTEITGELEAKTDTDLNENSVIRSFHADPQIHADFYTRVLNFGKRRLQKTPPGIQERIEELEVKPVAREGKAISKKRGIITAAKTAIERFDNMILSGDPENMLAILRKAKDLTPLAPRTVFTRIAARLKSEGLTPKQIKAWINSISGRYSTLYEHAKEGTAGLLFATAKTPKEQKAISKIWERIASGDLQEYGPEYNKLIKKHGAALRIHKVKHTAPFPISYNEESKQGVMFGPSKDLKKMGFFISKTTRERIHPLYGKQTLTSTWAERKGHKFLVVEAPILTGDSTSRQAQMENLISTMEGAGFNWYKHWRESMGAFTKKGIPLEEITKTIKIQGVMSAGRSPASASTLAATAIKDLEEGRKGKLAPANESQSKKIRAIWTGEEAKQVKNLDDRINFYGGTGKIGRMIHAVLSVEGDAVVIDRHMGRLWGYNLLWNKQGLFKSFAVTDDIQTEIARDVSEVAAKLKLPLADIQAAMWYAAGAEVSRPGTPAVSTFEDAIKVDPKKRLGNRMFIATTEESKKIVTFRSGEKFVIWGARLPRRLTPAERERLRFLRDKSSRMAFMGVLTPQEEIELDELSTAHEGDTPRPQSRGDVLKRMNASTEDNSYMPMSYWYEPGTRREEHYIGDVPHLTTVYEGEIYDGKTDLLGYIGAAHKRAAADPRVKSEEFQVNEVLTNALGHIIQDAGYKGFSLPSGNTGGVVYMFGTEFVEKGPVTITVAISDVVARTTGVPQDIDALEILMGQAVPEFLTHLRKELAKYNVDILESDPTIAKFEKATEGQFEYGMSLKLRGPKAAITAAMSAIVGLGRRQNTVYLMQDSETPNGTLVTFRVKREISPVKLHEFFTNRGITEYNKVFRGGRQHVEMLIHKSEENNPFLSQMEEITEEGTFQHKAVFSDILDTGNYKKHITNFFGKILGGTVHEQETTNGEVYASQAQVGIDRILGRSGLQRDTTQKRSDKGLVPPTTQAFSLAKLVTGVTENMSPLQYATMQELLGKLPDMAAKVGMPKEMFDRIQFEFADLTGLEIDSDNISKKAHEEKGDTLTSEDVLGAIAFNGLNATVQISNKLEHLDQLEGAVYHELYHALEKWMRIPAELMLKMLKHTPNFEDRAIGFSKYLLADKFEKGTPNWLRQHWLQLRRLLQMVANFLRNKGFFLAEDLYGQMITGAFLPRLALPMPAFLTTDVALSTETLTDEQAFTMAGKKSETADLNLLDRAKSMHELGTDKATIRNETGWFLAPDNMWRYEIDDSKFKIESDIAQRLLKVKNAVVNLGNMVTHPELFKAYPLLKGVKVSVMPGKGGEYNENTGRIRIGAKTLIIKPKALETMIHETQHIVQSIEGFARGGAVEEFLHLNTVFENLIATTFKDLMGVGLQLEKDNVLETYHITKGGKRLDPAQMSAGVRDSYTRVISASDKLRRLTTLAEDKITPRGQYLRLLGEIEARDVSERLKFDMLSRMAVEPYWSQGIPNDEIILRFEEDIGTGTVLSKSNTSEEVLFSRARTQQREDIKERGLTGPIKQVYVDRIGSPIWDYISEELPIRMSKRSTLVNRIAKGLILDFGKDEGFIEERDDTNARIANLTEKARRMAEEMSNLTKAEQVRASQIIRGSITTQSDKFKAAIEAAKAFQRLEKELTKLGILGPDNRFRKLTRKEVAAKFKEVAKHDAELARLEKSLTPQVHTSRVVDSATEDIVEELTESEEISFQGQAQARVTRWTEINESRIKEALSSRGFAKGEVKQMIQRVKDSVVIFENATGPVLQIQNIIKKTVRETLQTTITKEFRYDSRTMKEARISIRKKIRENLDARNDLLERIKAHYKESGKSYLRRAFAKIEEEKRIKKSLVSWIFRRNRLTPQGYSKKRKDMTFEYRQSLGEIQQAPFLVMKGLSEEAHDAEMMRLFTLIASNPKWAVEKKSVDLAGIHKGWKPLGATTKLGPLANMFVDEFIWDDLNEAVTERSEFIRQWDKLLSLWKLGKVPFNPATQIRNIITNIGLADFSNLNPHRIDIYVRAALDFRSKSGYWEEAKTTTLLGTEWAGAEVFKFLNEVASLEQDGTMLTKVTKAMMKILDKPSATYQGIEQFFKLAVFINERKSGRTIKQSAAHAEKFLFNYLKIPPWIRAAKRWYAPFITFSYKAMPRMAETAIKRPWKMAKYLIILSTIEAITRRLYGESEEEEEREKAVLPSYMRGPVLPGPLKHLMPGLLSHIRIPYRDQYNRSKYWDLSYILPWGDVAEQWGQSQIPFRPFMPSHPVYAVFDVAYNEIMFNGRELTIKDVDEGSEYWLKVGKQMWLQASPALISHSYTRFMRAATGEKDYMGRERSLTEAIFDVFFGIKIRSIDYTEARGLRLRKLQRAISSIKFEFKNDYRKLMMNPSSSPEKQQKRYQDLFDRLSRKVDRITDKILEVDNPK